MDAISSALEGLGIDPDKLQWYQLSICSKLGKDAFNVFYDGYESSERTARLADTICDSCPVRKICLAEGIENKEWGCWGGVFLENGKVSQSKNAHKTEQDWEKIKDLLNG